PIPHPDDSVRDPGTLQVSLDQAGVPVIIFGQQNHELFLGHAADSFDAACGAAGRVKRNVVPSPDTDSTEIFPPRRSRIRRTMASPIPSPGALSACSRCN